MLGQASCLKEQVTREFGACDTGLLDLLEFSGAPIW